MKDEQIIILQKIQETKVRKINGIALIVGNHRRFYPDTINVSTW